MVLEIDKFREERNAAVRGIIESSVKNIDRMKYLTLELNKFIGHGQDQILNEISDLAELVLKKMSKIQYLDGDQTWKCESAFERWKNGDKSVFDSNILTDKDKRE